MLPRHLIKKTPKHENIVRIRSLVGDDSVHTVCESASCPNIGECFSNDTLTFMILGDTCTRNCAFCGVKKGKPAPLDPDEPKKVSEAARKLGLGYVVVTSVTRDDLRDQGAGQFVSVINELRPLPVEVLIPDLQGEWEQLKRIADAGPFVINHNVETVPRLYKGIRPQADYCRSLELISMSKELSPDVYTKSGFMVGLGETDDEAVSLLLDLKEAGCDIVTIGQYLPPSKEHPKPERYVEPDTFNKYREEGMRAGLAEVFSGPFVRSSYRAGEILCNKKLTG